MRAAIDGVDVVGKGIDDFRIAVIILQGQFHGHRVFGGLEINGLLVQDFFVFVQMFDKFGDAAAVLELMPFVGSLIRDGNEHTFVEKGEFTQPLGQGVEVKFKSVKNGGSPA